MNTRRWILGLALAAVAALAVTATAVAVLNGYGPNTCLNGYVWRGASATDYVCVTPAVRAQTAYDNGQAAARRSPNGGAYGPNTCLNGYVWRAAFQGDVTCVAPAARSQAWSDNAQAASRRDEVRIWLGTYSAQQQTCNGNVCSQTSDDAPRFVLYADRLNTGAALVALFRGSTGRSIWFRYVTAMPNGSAPGGRLAVQTGQLKCGGANNAYFRVKDVSSGRWSSPLWVSSGCATL